MKSKKIECKYFINNIIKKYDMSFFKNLVISLNILNV